MDIFTIFEDKTLIIIYISGFLTLVYIICELFGIFHGRHSNGFLKWLQKQEKSLLLANVVCILSLSVKMYKGQKQVAEKTDKLEYITDKIDGKITLIDELTNVKKGFDPLLDSIFSVDMDEKISFFDQAINHKRYEIKDINKFQDAYSRTFDMFPSSHILATSLLDSSYFWSATGEPYRPMEMKMKNFISNGGKMTRIFYVDDRVLSLPRSQKVIERQIEIGVEVYTVHKENTSKQLFVLYDDRDFGWIVQIDPDNRNITNFLFTRNETDLKQFKEEFNKLKMNASCTRCSKQ